MLVEKLKIIDSDKILEAYHTLEKNIQWTSSGHKGDQAGIQYREGEDPWKSAVGKHTGADERQYSLLNPYFKDTIFEEIIKEYNLYRARLMWVSPFCCYTMHVDATKRLHIPLITNPECYFVFKQGSIEHLEKNGVYMVHTRNLHTFMNCSDQRRLHLVGISVD
jgi:hypothetical protein